MIPGTPRCQILRCQQAPECHHNIKSLNLGEILTSTVSLQLLSQMSAQGVLLLQMSAQGGLLIARLSYKSYQLLVQTPYSHLIKVIIFLNRCENVKQC